MKFLRLSEKEERVTPKGFRASGHRTFRATNRPRCVPLRSPMSTPRPFSLHQVRLSLVRRSEILKDHLKEHGIAYGKADVTSDSTAFEEMKRLSGQTKAPTMRWDRRYPGRLRCGRTRRLPARAQRRQVTHGRRHDPQVAQNRRAPGRFRRRAWFESTLRGVFSLLQRAALLTKRMMCWRKSGCRSAVRRRRNFTRA